MRSAGVLLASLVVVAATVGGWLRTTDKASVGASNAGAPTRLAVLPFENQGDAEKEYFADGITDEVRGRLATLPKLGP